MQLIRSYQGKSVNQRVRMNDFDEFAEIALAIFVGMTLLIWLLTYMERTLIDPASRRRNRQRDRPPSSTASRNEPPTDPKD